MHKLTQILFSWWLVPLSENGIPLYHRHHQSANSERLKDAETVVLYLDSASGFVLKHRTDELRDILILFMNVNGGVS